MEKPSLKTIFDFGLEVVEKETNNYIKSRDEYAKRYAKRYGKQVIIYSSVVWFAYSKKEISSFLNLNLNVINKYLSTVNRRQLLQEQAEELYNSLIYSENKSYSTFRAQILKEFRSNGGYTKPTQTKFEKWLINKLYELNK